MRAAAFGLLLLLVGCGQDKPLPPERPDAQGRVIKSVTAPLPKELEFAGRWATKPDLCETGWWDFGHSEIRTAGELSCAVTRDERTETSAKLQLTCVGEGMPSVEHWAVRSLDGGRLEVQRDQAPPVILARCPL